MNSEQSMVREFHQTFGHPWGGEPHTDVDMKTRNLRYELIREELEELEEAMYYNDLVEVADAIGDLLYVVYGTAEVYGIDAEPLMAEVHRSNMSKVWPDGKVYYREDGKVIKPPTFQHPDIAGVLKGQEKK